jgi:hypothetical protein
VLRNEACRLRNEYRHPVWGVEFRVQPRWPDFGLKKGSSQGQNLALTVSFVLDLHSSGTINRLAELSHEHGLSLVDTIARPESIFV